MIEHLTVLHAGRLSKNREYGDSRGEVWGRAEVSTESKCTKIKA